MSEEVQYSLAECLRCGQPLVFLGTRDFHEGTRWGFLGDLAELFVNKDRYELYGCSRCGHVEFFVEGVGYEIRQPRDG